MLAVLDKFLAGFYVANKVNFQNCLANFLNRLKNSQHVFYRVANKLTLNVKKLST